MKSVSILPILFLAFLVACSDPSAKVPTPLIKVNSIIGGAPAAPTDPVSLSTVSIIMNYQQRPVHSCTGVLISKNLVLTAAHCLKETPMEALSVFIGDTLPTDFINFKFIKIKAMVTHPGYHIGPFSELNIYTAYNDLGLIVLESDAEAPAVPTPILNDGTLPHRQSVLLAGYGVLQEIPYRVDSPGLYYTRVPLAFRYANMLVTDQYKAKGACAGDSGGPAFMETTSGLILLGVVRGAHDNAPDCRHYGEVTSASRFKVYILSKAAELGAEPPVFVDAPPAL